MFTTAHPWLPRGVPTSPTQTSVLHDHDWRVVAVDYDGFQQVTEMSCAGCAATLFV